jgi:hypothetical protein
MIFRQATDTPGILDISNAPPSGRTPRAWTQHGPASGPVVMQPRPPLRTKTSLTLVCKRWRNISIPLLYEWLYLRNVGAVRILVRALMRSLHETTSGLAHAEGATSYGPLVRRLDISIPNGPPYTWREDEIHELSQLVFLCPKLSIFTFCSSQKDNEALSPRIMNYLSRYCDDLRYLHWDARPDDSFYPRVETLASLEVLALLTPRVFSGVCPSIRLPKVHTLELGLTFDHHVLPYIAHWGLPALQRLIISGDLRDVMEPYYLFEALGSRLKSLDMSHTSDYDLYRILASCVALEEVSTTTTRFRSPLTSLPPRLRTVRIRFVCGEGRGRFRDECMKCLGDCMVTLKSSNHQALRTIQFTDIATEEISLDDHFWFWRQEDFRTWARWISMWKDDGVSFEDRLGGAITVPSPREIEGIQV